MKIGVINFSGNVGKTTVSRHLLAPRMNNAKILAIESTVMEMVHSQNANLLLKFQRRNNKHRH